jgi:hypothetical protein
VLLSPGQDVPDHFNLWQGFAVEPKRGSWRRMRRHLLKAICGGDRRRYRYLLNWMAYAVQYLGRPAEVALVMRGGRGAGKGLVGRTLGALFGPHFLQITQPGHLTGHFNGHLESTVLLFVDEGFWAGDKAGEGVLKGLITEPTMSIERKGLDVVRARNCLHIIIASNSDWVVPAGPDERRYFILDVDDSNKQDPAYFKPIYDEMEGEGLAAMLFDLQQRDLCSFDIRQVPQTKALGEQKLQSLPPTDKWWFDKLVAGTFFMGNFYPPIACDWAQVLTADLQSDYVRALQRFGISRKSTESELGRQLKKLLPPGDYRVRATADKQQVYYYKFPPVEDCRAHFEKLLKLEGRIDWTTGGLLE